MDRLWNTIREEVQHDAGEEPLLANFLYGAVLNHKSLEDAITFMLAAKLESTTIPAIAMRDLLEEAFDNDPGIGKAIRTDIRAVKDRDPACRGYSTPLLYFKGFHALQSYRAAHYFWARERFHLALFLQSRVSQTFGVDIHPAARIGCGVFMDHATGIVIGETAVVDDNVSMLHGVTLGGTGKDKGDRHPKVRRGVLIGANATILGNIEIGAGAKVGAGSLVLKPVPPHCTAVGVPAEIIKGSKTGQAGLEMDHNIESFHGDGI
ncbi:MAG TPA: serine O-acetyltransferase [Candidatus Hydrogenedentes bacterium]|nr:serine O-acetyltransferase [Candidatus Hydrogenedentota bacterium]